MDLKKRYLVVPMIALLTVSAAVMGVMAAISLYKQSRPPEEETRTVTLYPVKSGIIEEQAQPVDVTIRLIKRHYFFNQDDYAAVMDISGDRLYFNYDVDLGDSRTSPRAYMFPRNGMLSLPNGASDPDLGRREWLNGEKEPEMTMGSLWIKEDWALVMLAYIGTPYSPSDPPKELESQNYIGPADSVEEARDRFREMKERWEEPYGTAGGLTA